MMQATYKCCKKPLVNYICIQCSSIIHRSCIGKLKDVKKIEMNKIICCGDTNNQLSRKDDHSCESDDLEQTIHELAQESEMKNRFIEKMKKEHKLLLDEATRNETELNNIIEDQSKIIASLEKRVLELNAKTLDKNINFTNSSTQTHGPMDNLISVSTQSTQNSTSRATQCERNITLPVAAHHSTEEHVNYSELKNFNKQSEHTETQSVHKNCTRKSLILSGHTAYRCGVIFKKHVNSMKFDTQYLNLSKNNLMEITKNHITLSKNYNKNDFKIVFLGSGEAMKGKQLDDKVLSDIIINSMHTNLILIGIPYHSNRPVLNNFIEQINMKIKSKCMHVADVHFINPNETLRPYQLSNSGEIKSAGMHHLFSYISATILNPTSKSTGAKNTENANSNRVQAIATDSNCDYNQAEDSIVSLPDFSTCNITTNERRNTSNNNFLYPRLSQIQFQIV